ncbi:peptidylprolyl isomerase [Polaribacter sp. HL-MS24]|uniref:peptidylprolyl isomerase n=1 Tax=Polaribacter sp. HL-MS24 TaxID=3077735 RepID=UPI0029348E6D|nr:peptidylprolyl isomerase [Polaribacter sp. HL-MS24]WOC39911.1 peptidylprolyl isomerase [Polaribacter sp. HL-MS24]
MPYKTKVSKYIKSIILLSFFAISIQGTAQKVKIDGVAVVIGKNIVLDSDIDKFKQEVLSNSEGKIEISDCEMLEQLMLQKLLSHHAIIDSVTVSDSQINASVENNIAYFKQQYGSVEKMVSAYGFNDEDDLKKELYKIEKENALVKQEQQKITEKVDVTPEEVRLYYQGLKDKNELPEFPAEIELAQIVLYAEPTEEENNRIVEKLKEIRQDILDGSSFKMKAIINSDDPAVTQNGGKYELTKETQFIKEFKEVAFTLDTEGQISEPFKSLFGYHIIQLHKIKGNTRSVSHILMQPEIPDEKLKETEKKVEDIIKEIESGSITFEEAVKKYSQDKDTKNNGGLIINGQTGESKFDLTRMDPALYARVNDLQQGSMTPPFYDESRGGEKMYKFFYMRERTNTHTADLVQDYEKIQTLALRKKKEETIAKWSKEKIFETYIKLNNKHAKCSFERNWKKEIGK